MRKTQLLLLAALLTPGAMSAQTPAASQAPAPAADSHKVPTPLPVPGGGATLGPGGIPQPMDRPAPTKEEALKKAQQDAEEIADLQARRISQQLSLTPAQFTRVRALLLEREEELHKDFSPDNPASKDHPPTPQERQLKLQQVQQDTMNKISALLTPAQKQQFDALVAKSRAERSRRAAIAASRRPVVGAQGAGATTTPSTPAAPATPEAPAKSPAPASTPATPAPQSN